MTTTLNFVVVVEAVMVCALLCWCERSTIRARWDWELRRRRLNRLRELVQRSLSASEQAEAQASVAVAALEQSSQELLAAHRNLCASKSVMASKDPKLIDFRNFLVAHRTWQVHARDWQESRAFHQATRIKVDACLTSVRDAFNGLGSAVAALEWLKERIASQAPYKGLDRLWKAIEKSRVAVKSGRRTTNRLLAELGDLTGRLESQSRLRAAIGRALSDVPEYAGCVSTGEPGRS